VSPRQRRPLSSAHTLTAARQLDRPPSAPPQRTENPHATSCEIGLPTPPRTCRQRLSWSHSPRLPASWPAAAPPTSSPPARCCGPLPPSSSPRCLHRDPVSAQRLTLKMSQQPLQRATVPPPRSVAAVHLPAGLLEGTVMGAARRVGGVTGHGGRRPSSPPPLPTSPPMPARCSAWASRSRRRPPPQSLPPPARARSRPDGTAWTCCPQTRESPAEEHPFAWTYRTGHAWRSAWTMSRWAAEFLGWQVVRVTIPLGVAPTTDQSVGSTTNGALLSR
jgi:hypothetical protein